MKKDILLASIIMILSVAIVSGQEPTERWPYLYDSFILGTVRAQDGTLLERKMNICVGDGALHYIGGDDLIMAAKMSTVFSARLGEDVFLRVGEKMLRLLSESGDAAVLEGYVIDTEKMNSTQIGYGISSKTASSSKLTNLALPGGTYNFVLNMNLYDVLAMKGSGNALPLKRMVYLRSGNKIVPASKHAVLGMEGINEDAVKAFFKENKIKWNKTESLLKVAVFLRQYE